MINPMQLMQMLQMSSNPQMLMQQHLGNDPAFQRAMQMAQGKSEQELRSTVMNLASQRGISPDQLQQMASQFGIRL